MRHPTLPVALLLDILPGASVIELPRLEERDVAEPVPLSPGLRIEAVEVIVGEAGSQGFDGVLEGRSAEGRGCGDVEGETWDEQLGCVCTYFWSQGRRWE